jgi:adenosylhomocysteine nucleosidase
LGAERDVTVILGALPVETVEIEGRVMGKEVRRIQGIDLVVGRIGGREVAVGWTGIGKVNAAMTSTLAVEHFRPAEVIFCGIAGAVNPELEPGDVVIGERTAQHDLGVWTEAGIENRGEINRMTGKRNPTFFGSDERLVRVAEEAAEEVRPARADGAEARVIVGTVVTGDVFVMSRAKCEELRARLGADALEMEGAAAAQICYQFGVPFVVIRSISDDAGEAALEIMGVHESRAASNAGRIAARVAELLGARQVAEAANR